MTIDHTNIKEDWAVRFDKETNDSARIASAIGYLFFFVPTVMHPESKFARYHENQALILTIMTFLGSALIREIPTVGPWLMLVWLLFCFVCMIRGIVLALKGKAKRIPFFGKLVIVEFEYMYSMEM